MACLTPRTGRNGWVADYTGSVINRIARFQKWSMNTQGNPDVRVYSGTRLGEQRIAGPEQTTGTFQAFGASPPLFVGDTFTFLGYTAPTTGVACTPGCTYIVDAIVDTLTITWNWTAQNKSVFYEIGWSSVGALGAQAFDDPCDDEVYCDTLCDLGLEIQDPCDGNSPVDFCNLTQAVLTFSGNNIEYSNSSTDCEIRKLPGHLSWTLELSNENPCLILELQKDYRILIDATTTTQWILEWGFHDAVRNFNIDTQTDTIISKVESFAMQAVLCCPGDDPVRGRVVHPDGTVLWPYSTPASSP